MVYGRKNPPWEWFPRSSITNSLRNLNFMGMFPSALPTCLFFFWFKLQQKQVGWNLWEWYTKSLATFLKTSWNDSQGFSSHRLWGNDPLWLDVHDWSLIESLVKMMTIFITFASFGIKMSRYDAGRKKSVEQTRKLSRRRPPSTSSNLPHLLFIS